MAVPVAAGVAIVIAAPDLHKADAAFEESPGGQTFAAEGVDFFGGINFCRPRGDVIANAVHFQGFG